MRPIKTRQRYKCDFCKKVGVKSSIEKHEKKCYRNPDRYCDECGNKGFTVEYPSGEATDCYACKKYDREELLKDIERKKLTPNP
jgi:hypothetical protein